MLIRMLALAAFAPLMLLAACGGDDDNASTTPKASQTTSAVATTAGAVGTNPASAGAKDVTITAADITFDKTNITAAAGQAINITLENNDSTEHSFTVGSTDVTEAEGGEIGQGGFTASATTLEFHCKYHSSTMKGTITITGSSSSNGLNTSPASASAAPAGIGGGY